MDIAPGATAEVSGIVDADRTAHAMGNRGVHVFATPFLIGMLEDAAGSVLRPHLAPGAGTVGTMVEVKHLAATPVGMKVRARARLLESDGKRYLSRSRRGTSWTRSPRDGTSVSWSWTSRGSSPAP
jgi:fluoroacetyl-CoA thioesterase